MISQNSFSRFCVYARLKICKYHQDIGCTRGLRRAYTQKRENEFSDIIAGFYDGIGHGINKNAKKQSVLKY